jgi:cyclophilin family peptidyl-prolyl cis-trans isomerase
VSKATKRERQRQNREVARAREIAVAKRRQRTKALRNALIAGVLVFGVVLLINTFTGGGSTKKKKASTATSAPAVTSAPAATTTPVNAAGCENVSKPAPKTATFKAAPPMTIDASKTYTAVMDTSCGKITLTLDAKGAPVATNNFVFLARQHFYDNEWFHRVVSNFVIQDGDPKGDGTGGPGYSVQGEAPKDGYQIGSLAAAKSGSEPAGTMSSQYFIVTGSNGATLPNDYARFGKVTGGMDVANKIGSFAPANDTSGAGTPTKVVTIKSVTITES